jgi:hypothetical protein
MTTTNRLRGKFLAPPIYGIYNGKKGPLFKGDFPSKNFQQGRKSYTIKQIVYLLHPNEIPTAEKLYQNRTVFVSIAYTDESKSSIIL